MCYSKICTSIGHYIITQLYEAVASPSLPGKQMSLVPYSGLLFLQVFEVCCGPWVQCQAQPPYPPTIRSHSSIAQVLSVLTTADLQLMLHSSSSLTGFNGNLTSAISYLQKAIFSQYLLIFAVDCQLQGRGQSAIMSSFKKAYLLAHSFQLHESSAFLVDRLPTFVNCDIHFTHI